MARCSRAGKSRFLDSGLIRVANEPASLGMIDGWLLQVAPIFAHADFNH